MNLANYSILLDILTAVVSFYGFMLFSFWWFRTRRATPGFVYVLFLLFVTFFERFLSIYFHLLKGALWSLNSFLTLLAVSILVIHMTARVWLTIRKTKHLRQQMNNDLDKTYKYSLLLVEDDVIIPSMLHKVFGDVMEDVKMFMATSVSDAMDILKKKNRIDIILTDIHFGSKTSSGFDLCRYIRKFHPHTTVIGMTGYPQLYSMVEARQAGFDDYFLKPFRVQDLLLSIEHHLRRIDRWRELSERDY